VILVEDSLAEIFLNEILSSKPKNRVLYKIIPIGGWEKVLEIYQLNESKKIFSDAQVLVVLDGDVKEDSKKGVYSSIKKKFLPLDNIEKYVVQLIVDKNYEFITYIEDKTSPRLFKDLDYFVGEEPLKNTKSIKNVYSNFIKAVQKETSHTSYDELQKQIIQYVLNVNREIEAYQKFEKDILQFINNDETVL